MIKTVPIDQINNYFYIRGNKINCYVSCIDYLHVSSKYQKISIPNYIQDFSFSFILLGRWQIIVWNPMPLKEPDHMSVWTSFMIADEKAYDNINNPYNDIESL